MPTAKKLKEDFRPKATNSPTRDCLSTGLDVLNVALSGRANGGVAKGTYEYFVGDSESGKTLMTLTLFAEACLNRAFDGYDLIYDGVENGLMMELAELFGSKVTKRLRPPVGTMERPCPSQTVEDFYRRLDTQLDRKPCIWVEDSMDALLSEVDEERFQKSKEGEETGGSYGTGKAKANSDNIKRAVSKLSNNGSILVIISQTRDAIGGGPFQSKTRAGGKALRFYAHVELWTSIIETTKIKYKGKDRTVGNIIQVDVRKNRMTGWHGKLKVPFVRGVGLDNLGASIKYLVDEGHWKKKEGIIQAKELSISGTEEDLIREIEANESERELQIIVQTVWREIEAATKVQRKKRYL